MADKSKYYDLLQAFSLGCLDKEELDELKKYFAAGEEYEWQELGEYQNLIALLPSILIMETPDPQLKDKVARKLYSYTTGKRSKRETGNYVAAKTEIAAENVGQDEAILSEPNDKNGQEIKTGIERDNADGLKEQHEAKASEIVIEEKNAPQKSLTESLQERMAARDKKKSGGFADENRQSGRSWLVFSTLLFLFVAAGMVFLYYKVSSEVNTYKSGIENLNAQIKDFSLKLSESQELQNVLQTKNVRIVNLEPTKLASSGFGKLIISLENSKGFLQLAHLPSLPNDKAYQLWIFVGSKYISLGIFTPGKDVDYFKFVIPELSNRRETDFILTAEPAAGSTTPGKAIYLSGSLK